MISRQLFPLLAFLFNNGIVHGAFCTNPVQQTESHVFLTSPFTPKQRFSPISRQPPRRAWAQLKEGASDATDRVLEETAVSSSAVRNALAQELLDFAANVGQVGSKATEEERQQLVDIASKLEPLSDDKPAQKDLKGIHDLIYSASPGGSSGAVGPFVGRVEQRFINDKEFYNVVMLPGVEIKLLAERNIMDDNRLKVKFVETTISVLGFPVKSFPVKGAGVWKQLFVGEVDVKPKGSATPQRTLLRVMEAPSLFIIQQPLE